MNLLPTRRTMIIKTKLVRNPKCFFKLHITLGDIEENTHSGSEGSLCLYKSNLFKEYFKKEIECGPDFDPRFYKEVLKFYKYVYMNDDTKDEP